MMRKEELVEEVKEENSDGVTEDKVRDKATVLNRVVTHVCWKVLMNLTFLMSLISIWHGVM